MLYVLFSVIIIVAFVQYLLLDTSLIFTIISVLFCMAGIGLCLLGKKLSKALAGTGRIVCVVLACVLLIPAGNGKNPVSTYENDLGEARKALEKGKLDQGIELLEEMEETYGQDDNIICLRTVEMVSKGDYEGAYEEIERMSDRKSMLYYAVKEQIYTHDSSGETIDGICAMYLEAAKEWPEWTHMQKYAGIAQLEKDQYESAVYFLERAVVQDMEDAESYYYLGAANYYLNNYETSQTCFEKALEYDLAEEYYSDIVWYVQNMTEGGEE